MDAHKYELNDPILEPLHLKPNLWSYHASSETAPWSLTSISLTLILWSLWHFPSIPVWPPILSWASFLLCFLGQSANSQIISPTTALLVSLSGSFSHPICRHSLRLCPWSSFLFLLTFSLVDLIHFHGVSTHLYAECSLLYSFTNPALSPGL